MDVYGRAETCRRVGYLVGGLALMVMVLVVPPIGEQPTTDGAAHLGSGGEWSAGHFTPLAGCPRAAWKLIRDGEGGGRWEVLAVEVALALAAGLVGRGVCWFWLGRRVGIDGG
jgi:hypothetical protein